VGLRLTQNASSKKY
jgi:hypothetical protein